MTPTARSMKYLRERGWMVTRVEQRLHMPGHPFPITKDAFGFGDLLVCSLTDGIALVQVTSTGHMAAREEKIQSLIHTIPGYDSRPSYSFWLVSGGRIFVHGWAKRGPGGERKLWTLTAHEIVLDSVADAVPRKSLPVSRREGRPVRPAPARSRRTV